MVKYSRMNKKIPLHYDGVIMDTIASQITSLTIVYSTVYSGADQRKHQSSASLAFVWGIHRGPVNSPHKWPVRRKMFPFDDVIMTWYFSKWNCSTRLLWTRYRTYISIGSVNSLAPYKRQAITGASDEPWNQIRLFEGRFAQNRSRKSSFTLHASLWHRLQGIYIQSTYPKAVHSCNNWVRTMEVHVYRMWSI